jgi:hypothetical protein
VGEEFCIARLAQRLAEIAARTQEPETAARLVALVDEVLAADGLVAEPRGAGTDPRRVGRRQVSAAAAS